MGADDQGGPSVGGLFTPLTQALDTALGTCAASGTGIAVLLVHCGGIERADARLGYYAGGVLAEKIEDLLRRQVLRKDDLVAPLTRDEFACVLNPAPSEGVAILAAHRAIAVLGADLDLGGLNITPDVSIGIAMFPDHGKSAQTLLQNAKSAQQIALRQRDRLWVCAGTDQVEEQEQAIYLERLKAALLENTLSLAFQPQLDLRTGRIVGAEALLRWQDELLGPVPPNRIVAIAEQAGLMDNLTFWVVTGAIQWCAKFIRVDPQFSVSINVSPSNLREPDLAAYIDRALRTWRVPGANIVVEITETAMVTDQKSANAALADLKGQGVHLSIDDFGTGYSSMYYLAQLPLHELKIDLMFVRDMLETPNHAKIVRSLIELAHNLELTVVAEGVENADILLALQHLGCDRAQGWHIGKPAPPGELLEQLRQSSVTTRAAGKSEA